MPDDDPLYLSVLEMGVVSPIFVSADGWIIKGRRRYVAAKKANIPDSDIPFIKELE